MEQISYGIWSQWKYEIRGLNSNPMKIKLPTTVVMNLNTSIVKTTAYWLVCEIWKLQFPQIFNPDIIFKIDMCNWWVVWHCITKNQQLGCQTQAVRYKNSQVARFHDPNCADGSLLEWHNER